MSGEQLGEVEASRLDAAAFEQRRLAHMLRRRGVEIEALKAERDRLAAELSKVREELGQASYEARRAERRIAKVEDDAAEAQRRYRGQLDSVSADLQAALASRDEALARNEKVVAERDEALAAVPEIEREARELGRAEIETERLLALEREREAALADSAATLREVATHLRSVERSRSWRWGRRMARLLRALSFRGRSGRSALDVALERLEADAGVPDERRGA